MSDHWSKYHPLQCALFLTKQRKQIYRSYRGRERKRTRGVRICTL